MAICLDVHRNGNSPWVGYEPDLFQRRSIRDVNNAESCPDPQQSILPSGRIGVSPAIIVAYGGIEILIPQKCHSARLLGSRLHKEQKKVKLNILLYKLLVKD